MQSYSTLKSKGTTATISGLKPATRYIFQVRARTSAGCGRFSQTVEVETGKPGECAVVGCERCGAGSMGDGGAFVRSDCPSAMQGERLEAHLLQCQPAGLA